MSDEDRVLKIISQVAARYGYTADELLCVDTHKHVTAVRQYAMWRAKKETGLTFTALGRLFDRTAETVSFGCKIVEALPAKERGRLPPRPVLVAEPIKPLCLPIIKEEAQRNGYTLEQLVSDDRHAHVTAVRQYAMWRAKKETGRRWVEICRFFKRDHTTVMHGYRRVESLPEEERGVFPARPRLRRKITDSNYGLKFEGAPCPHGHTTRYWSSGDCVPCQTKRDRLRSRRKRKTFFAEAAE